MDARCGALGCSQLKTQGLDVANSCRQESHVDEVVEGCECFCFDHLGLYEKLANGLTGLDKLPGGHAITWEE